MVIRINLEDEHFDRIPDKAAVYAIFSDKGFHFVGETDNLSDCMKVHLDPNKANNCLKNIFKSSKEKLMIYELMPKSSRKERLHLEKEWIEKYKPSCNYGMKIV